MFNTWIDTFIEEKSLFLEEGFEVQGPSGFNIMSYGVIVETMKSCSPQEEKNLKNKIVEIDFKNGDIKHFFRHLGKSIAK